MKPAELDSEGTAAPPRANGELVFLEPWERRVFGITMALTESALDYGDFRERLNTRIAEDESRAYWVSWELALEDVARTSCAVTSTALHERHAALLARPHGHDHRHD